MEGSCQRKLEGRPVENLMERIQVAVVAKLGSMQGTSTAMLSGRRSVKVAYMARLKVKD